MISIARKDWAEIDLGRCLFIDFEGEKDKEPVLVGILDSQMRLNQVVVSEAMSLVTSQGNLSTRINHLVYRDVSWLRSFLKESLETSDTIVAWSNHEKDVLSDLIFKGEKSTWNYLDARLVAKSWRAKYHPDVKPKKHNLFEPSSGHSLKFYEDLTGYRRPALTQGGSVGKTIRRVESGFIKRAEMTPGEKKAWTNLVRHNEQDLRGLRHVLEFCLPNFNQYEPNEESFHSA